MTPAPTVCHSGIEPRRILICQKKSPRKLDVWDASKPYSTIVAAPSRSLLRNGTKAKRRKSPSIPLYKRGRL